MEFFCCQKPDELKSMIVRVINDGLEGLVLKDTKVGVRRVFDAARGQRGSMYSSRSKNNVVNIY